MLEKHGRSIMIIANIVIAVTAVLTLIALVIVGIFWLGELNSDVEQNQQSIVEVRQDIKDVRQELKDVRQELKREIEDLRDELKQEIADTRREILAAIEDSNRQMLDALANHTHDEDGNAIFTRPVVQE